ncbi:MAG TPA: periplasmic heavy metal sensor [Syntrophorhabdales bacterium]|nr:periplasmic heavy metal sensor [Syntrophorhabdales bacterium]
MKERIAFGFVALAVISWVACTDALCQFTQGPPGNPSAAGIMSGTPVSSPPPPRVPGTPMSPPQGGMTAFTMDIPYATPETSPIVAYLGLTRAQLDKCRELRNRFYRETRDLRYDYFQKQLEMRKLFADPKVGEAKLLEKEKELSPIRQKILDKAAQIIIAARTILTPEQMEKLDQLPLLAPGIGISPDLGFLSGDVSMGSGE